MKTQIRRMNKKAMKIIYRKAQKTDIPQLAKMRWDFQLVGRESCKDTEKEFDKSCEEFFEEQFDSGSWVHFLAEVNNEIIAHVSLQIIKNIPVPGTLKNYWGYLTNAYTKKEFRKKGIGTNLVKQSLEWADANDLKKIVLWPREASINIYKDLRFSQKSEIMERKAPA